jgi:hypothetical protein
MVTPEDAHRRRAAMRALTADTRPLRSSCGPRPTTLWRAPGVALLTLSGERARAPDDERETAATLDPIGEA